MSRNHLAFCVNKLPKLSQPLIFFLLFIINGSTLDIQLSFDFNLSKQFCISKGWDLWHLFVEISDKIPFFVKPRRKLPLCTFWFWQAASDYTTFSFVAFQAKDGHFLSCTLKPAWDIRKEWWLATGSSYKKWKSLMTFAMKGEGASRAINVFFNFLLKIFWIISCLWKRVLHIVSYYSY